MSNPRVYQLQSPLTGEIWDDARGAAGLISGVSMVLGVKLKLRRWSATGDALHRLVAAADHFAHLPSLEETDGEVISSVYWEAAEVVKAMTGVVGQDFIGWPERDWCSPDALGRPFSKNSCPGATCEACGGTGFTRAPGPPRMHAQRAALIGAMFIKAGSVRSERSVAQSEQHRRLAIVIAEADRAGIDKEDLRRQEWVWRFFACGGRMPLSESLLLAFQAAWEIGHHDFARSIARQGFGALTSEQAAKLGE